MDYFNEEDVSTYQKKIPILVVIMLLSLFIILARLFYLQVYKGRTYRLLADQISIRELEIHARRGRILDRNGKVLADIRDYFEITVIPQYLREPERVFKSLKSLLGLDPSDLRKKLEAAKREPLFQPIVLVEDASYDQVARLRQVMRPDYKNSVYFLEGVEVRLSPLRQYLYPALFAHALGYLKEVDEKGLTNLKKYPGRYSRGDLLGASGIESAHDLSLRGQDGVLAKVVDAKGHEVRGEKDLELLANRASLAPIAGVDLKTTLDFHAQEIAAQAMEGRRGAVVAMDPHTGELLVFYSSPSFDPNRIIQKVDRDYWKLINLHEDQYLFNRAIQGLYPPGSIYKVVGAYAGLDSGKITPATRFHCGGGLQFGSRFFKCWKKGGHGTVDFNRGIAQSCDVYFYQVGLKLGVDLLHDYALKFGYGQKTGVEIPFEQGGLIPSKAWKESRYGPWIESETLSIVIGQGYDLVTPLQAALMISRVANNGLGIMPHFTKTESPLSAPLLSQDVLREIQKGVIAVVQGEGTATRLKQSPNKIAGKTGTAQVVGHEFKGTQNERTKPHAWFVAYAPYDDPKIALVVLVENGEGGSKTAAPIAMQIIDVYLRTVQK